LAAVAPFTPVPPYWAPMAVPCQVPEVMVPVAVMLERLPVVMMVPETFGRVSVLSAVGSVSVRRVSKVSAVAPSKMIPVVPKTELPAASAGLPARVAE